MSSVRARSIRTKIVRLLLIPLVSLTLLWGYAAAVIGENALRSRHWDSEAQRLIQLRTQLEQLLMAERTISVVFATSPQVPR
ncbi:hypothetical protein ACFQ07_06400, partial [Actinomadura adrarensis]